MKKLTLLLVALLALTGCGSKANEEKPAETSKLKVGTGIVSTINVADPGEKDGKFEGNVTYATVVLDGDKIKFVTIDTAQNAIAVKADGTTSFEERKTKKELGNDYGMSKAGKVEWFEQIAKLEEWMIGKTVAEIAKADADTDLTSSVSIKTPGYIEAVTKAAASAVEVSGLVKVGVASSTTGSEKEGKLEISTVVTAVALDKDGKSLSTVIDQAQLKGTLEGTVVGKTEELRTKGEQKEDYGMSGAGKVEWYKQVETLTNWSNGKTIDEISGAKDASDVTSSVSITIDGFLSTIKKASEKAVAL
jgi:hypothetical protein